MPNFNAFMHRRNIFRKEPDFTRLASEYDELKPYLTVGIRNKVKFDFKSSDALRALTCVLLRKYFQKQITLPPDRLIPAVPQRLNYICWVEDLVRLLEPQTSDIKVCGIDIGTGASCIFPILTCHRNPTWSIVGVEADDKSHQIATLNVQQNFMDNRIRVIKVHKEQELYEIIGQTELPYPITFIMCNPPFFEEEYDVTMEVNSGVQSRPKSIANTSIQMESVTSGGEIAFVGRMLVASQNLRQEVSIYTSMLGRKQSLIHFKQTLSSMSDENLSWTWAELCQGKTIRYAIAWSFQPGLDLTRAPPLKHGKNKSWKFKLVRKMTKRDSHLELLENSEFVKNLVSHELMIAKAKIVRQTQQLFEMLIKTNDKTWANQRRKRRERMNRNKHRPTSSFIIEKVKNYVDTGDTQMVCDMNEASNSQDDASTQASCSKTFTSTVSQQVSMETDLRDCIDGTVKEQSNSTYQEVGLNYDALITGVSRKRKNASSCSSSPPRIFPSPNDGSTDDDNQSTTSEDTDLNDDSSRGPLETKRICLTDEIFEHMDDIYDYLLCCRIFLIRVNHDLYFELKLEHPCTAAKDAYDLFLYFRNKLSDK